MAAFQQALPLFRQSGMDVVAFGRSEHEHESFYLIRAFADQAQLTADQDAFYSSQVWKRGPREAIVACIDSYLNTLLWLSDEGVEDMRQSNGLLI